MMLNLLWEADQWLRELILLMTVRLVLSSRLMFEQIFFQFLVRARVMNYQC